MWFLVRPVFLVCQGQRQGERKEEKERGRGKRKGERERGERDLPISSFSYKDNSPIGSGPHSFDLI